jgi:hypothetical protein
VNASVGRVHITRYTGTVTLEVARASQADYIAHCERVGSNRNPVLMISERPFPYLRSRFAAIGGRLR